MTLEKNHLENAARILGNHCQSSHAALDLADRLAGEGRLWADNEGQIWFNPENATPISLKTAAPEILGQDRYRFYGKQGAPTPTPEIGAMTAQQVYEAAQKPGGFDTLLAGLGEGKAPLPPLTPLSPADVERQLREWQGQQG